MPKDLAQTLFNSPFTHFSSYSGYPKIQFHVSDPSLCTFNQVFKTIFIICFFFQLDYFSAFSIVVYSLLAFFLRILGSWRSSKGIKWSNFAAIIACGTLFVRHIFLLNSADRFDYGYNMAVNVGVGLVNSFCWLFWCYQHWNENIQQRRKYVKNAVISVLLLDLSVLLELLDFVPIFWTFDAHALWHLSTVPIHYFWYKFVSDDCEYLLKNEHFDYHKTV